MGSRSKRIRADVIAYLLVALATIATMFLYERHIDKRLDEQRRIAVQRIDRQALLACRYVTFTRETQRLILERLQNEAETASERAVKPLRSYFAQEVLAWAIISERTEPPLSCLTTSPRPARH